MLHELVHGFSCVMINCQPKVVYVSFVGSFGFVKTSGKSRKVRVGEETILHWSVPQAQLRTGARVEIPMDN